MEKIEYLNELVGLVKKMSSYSNNSDYIVYAKVTTLAVMNLRYEKIAFNKKLSIHPYLLTKEVIKDAKVMFDNFIDLKNFEGPQSKYRLIKKSEVLEEKHEELWQEIWSRHSREEFDEFVNMKHNRLVINDLIQYVNNKKCVDFGAGNGSFAFALESAGASKVHGIDFGEKQVEYSKKVSEYKDLKEVVSFSKAEVYDSKLESNSFDFAVSNGVFHHLKHSNIEKAIEEVSRVLKPNGWFWYYIDGEGAISMDLWDASVEILKEVPILKIETILNSMNLSRNKMVHVMDAMSATYIHSSLEETTSVLKKYGFSNFKRLTGGEPTDFDLDVVESDPYGKEKFGCGDLRILCQLVD
jgi:ubiquinone/menaquinone biosynthesis C-methylase UbiE